MLKRLTATLTHIRILVLMLILLCAPCASMQAYADTDPEETVFTLLTDEVGLSPAAACGVMANMKAESNFKPAISNPWGGAYGLCQWLGPRQTALQSFCASKGYKVSSIKGQIMFMKHELDTQYTSVKNYLHNVPNTADGAYQAGYYFCFHFEAPGDIYNASTYRGNLAKNTYWPLIGSGIPRVQAADTAAGIKLTWTLYQNRKCVIKRCWKSNGPWTEIGRTAAGKKTFTDKTVPAGKTYYYKVFPLDAKGKELGGSTAAHATHIGVLSEETAVVTLGRTSLTYNGKKRKPSVTVRCGGKTLVKGQDFLVKYSANINAGTAGVKITGTGNYKGTLNASFEIKKAKQVLQVKDFVIRYRDGSKKLKTGAKGKVTLKVSDPSVLSTSANVITFLTTGKVKVTVKAAGTANYLPAQASFNLTVLPAPPVWKNAVRKGTKAAQVKWETVPKCHGYEIQYIKGASGSSFNGASVLRVKKASASSTRITGLSAGAWRMRSRSYRVYQGKRLYSRWGETIVVK